MFNSICKCVFITLLKGRGYIFHSSVSIWHYQRIVFYSRFSSIDTLDGMQYNGQNAPCNDPGMFPNGMSFTTFDSNNGPSSNNCAANDANSNGGGWWYNINCVTCSVLTDTLYNWIYESNGSNDYAMDLAETTMMIKIQ